MDFLLNVVLIVFAVLQIILFFKIWGMTNDVQKIKEEYICRKEKITNENQTVSNDSKFQINSHVVEKKTGKQMRIQGRLNDGKYVCLPSGMINTKDFEEDEIELFSIYVEN